MSEVDQLRREILRLEALLDDNGIDHESEQFGPPDRPAMGPPTLMEHTTALMLRGISSRFVASLTHESMFRQRLTQDVKYSGRTIGDVLHIKLPTDFQVRQ